jgi:TnpA family transposase
MMDEIFNLDNEELTLVKAKNTNKNKLGFAILLKYFQLEGHYPKSIQFIDPLLIKDLANQLDINPLSIKNFNWEGRSIERFRSEIRDLTGFKKANIEDSKKLIEWLIKNILPKAPKPSECIEYAYEYFRATKVEPFTSNELERYIQSAHSEFEQNLFTEIYNNLSKETINLMDFILRNSFEKEGDEEQVENYSEIKFNHLKKDTPGAKLKNVAFEINKISRLKQLNLPSKLLDKLSKKLIRKYYDRIFAEPPSSILTHEPKTRYASFSLFCYFRSQILIDNLADLFIQLVHKMKASAESFVNKKIITEVRHVNGKFDILYSLASTSISHPDGIIKEVIYPQVGKDKLNDIIKELDYKGKWYQSQVQKKIRSLYSHASRKILLTLLDAFEFKTNIHESKPLLEAIALIKKYRDKSIKYYPDTVDVPVKQVVPNEWLLMVIETENDNIIKINCINYEIAVLEELRRQLRCKIIWVEGASRYRNPDDDLPKDFEEKRQNYYKMMDLPIDANEFIKTLKESLDCNLKKLNNTIVDNNKVKIISKNGGRIKISPSDPQAEPPNIKKLHREIQKRWSTISLIDILKETDLHVGFSDKINTVASRENVSKEKLQKRLLLSLYGIGSNTGLKRMSAANSDVNYSDLRYVKRRFINVANVRAAIAEIVNKILEIRDPRIWGETTTSVVCDSKKINAWDQNLIAEWHARYKGRGVMVYWHVELKSTCIYSQLKTCSSSEVGSMIKGILDHCTKMEINEAYVDTHGQSTIGFGVSHLLHFDLLPRLKNINKQKLYYPSSNSKKDYQNLEEILQEPINWKLISDYYDEVIKHVVALKTGTVEPDVLIKRFSKDNYNHPVYKALTEIGKASKTIFLCRYLMSEELRIEINEALNVVERVNSIMGFIFYGKLGEISTNIKEDQELAIICLHLLEVCMVYINTLIIQEVLSEPEWEGILATTEDKRALTPLIHAHINPYGLFPLDLDKRLGLTVFRNNNVEDEIKSELMVEEYEFD